KFIRTDEIYFRPDPDKAIPRRAFFYEAIQAPGVVDPTGIANCLILSRGGVQAGRGIQHSVVFANGDVTARTVMISVVVVCDGDVAIAEEYISRSLIVARGNITAKWAGKIVLMAGGKIEVENKDDIKGKNNNIVLENKPNMLGITFFELSTVGLEVKTADKLVQVKAVTAGKPCEKAGVKVGDAILEVNGKKPTDAESLRRLLRDNLAIGDATVKLKRADKTETLKVALPE
ncbi:MAG: PDZ domain-containing protein, partial [Planctomycetia bacterium]|nr:PDZ domain-containing protein [Planctomycetia bacterium]